MSTEVRRVFILGVLAFALGGYTYATAPEKKPLGTATAKKTERPALDFTADKVQQIDVVFEGERLVCQRTPHGWVEPSSGTPVRQDAIDDFLANLQKLLNLGEVEGGPEQLAEFGLQSPVSRIMLQVEGEGTRLLSIGKNNPPQTSLYAQIDDAPQVVLVGSVIMWDMRKLFAAAGLAG